MFTLVATFQLLAAHENELELMSEKLDAEKQRQQLSLRERLAEKRKRKMADLRRKQEAELTREMLTQKKELDEIRTTKVREDFFTLTLYVLDCLGKYKMYLHFLQFLDMRWCRLLKSFLMENKDLFILCNQYHCCWWPGGVSKTLMSS